MRHNQASLTVKLYKYSVCVCTQINPGVKAVDNSSFKVPSSRLSKTVSINRTHSHVGTTLTYISFMAYWCERHVCQPVCERVCLSRCDTDTSVHWKLTVSDKACTAPSRYTTPAFTLQFKGRQKEKERLWQRKLRRAPLVKYYLVGNSVISCLCPRNKTLCY